MDYRNLPVYQQRDTIIKALEQHQVIVVESPTGSGKTTQLPVILDEAGYTKNGVIGVTQPRRLAAISVCEYIDRHFDSTNKAAYKIRFEDTTTPATEIKIMTDGILLQEMKADPLLSAYSVIMVDEAHERSLNIDFILGLLKRVLEERPEFKVIISSATINPAIFSQYYNQCPVVSIDTPVFPVDLMYQAPGKEAGPEGLYDVICDVVHRVLDSERKGDILVFLSGERMIKECITALYSQSYRKKLHILPLYGRLGREEQEKVFDPTPKNKTKVVVCTNIAETSITIDGITTVIDSGLAKINFYNPRTFTASLNEVPVSKASSNQRRGRAGRTQPGACYRLYKKEDFDSRPLFTTEEIYRTDLSEVVLRMAELGIRDFEAFDFISPPGKQGLIGAVETLFLLDALEKDNSLSKIGEMMAVFPLLPRHSRIIVEGIMNYPDSLEKILIGVSYITTNSPYLLPQGEEMEARKAHHTFKDKRGDFISYLKLYNAFVHENDKEGFCERYYLDLKTMNEIVNIKTQLQEIVSGMGVPVAENTGSLKDYLCAMGRGLIQFVCALQSDKSYKSLTASNILIHPGSVMFRERPEYIVAGEIVKTSRMYARSVSELDYHWLGDISPELQKSLAAFKKGKQGGSRGRSAESDTGKAENWQITIGGQPFKLRPYKGKKKLAVLPWKDLSKAVGRKKITVMSDHKSVRGIVLFKQYELLPEEQIGNILKILKLINPDRDFIKKMPVRGNYNSFDGTAALLDALENILKLVPAKGKSPDLGFITLFTDGEGTYWFKIQKNFFQAISQSLASLEVLADELDDKNHTNRVNRVYRWLVSFFDM